jgi:hypothetical protein
MDATKVAQNLSRFCLPADEECNGKNVASEAPEGMSYDTPSVCGHFNCSSHSATTHNMGTLARRYNDGNVSL